MFRIHPDPQHCFLESTTNDMQFSNTLSSYLKRVSNIVFKSSQNLIFRQKRKKISTSIFRGQHHRIKRWQNGPPLPPSLPSLLHRVAAKQHCKISRNTKFLRNYFEFREIWRNVRNILWNTKLNISQKFREITKTKFLLPPYSYTILSASQTPVC